MIYLRSFTGKSVYVDDLIIDGKKSFGRISKKSKNKKFVFNHLVGGVYFVMNISKGRLGGFNVFLIRFLNLARRLKEGAKKKAPSALLVGLVWIPSHKMLVFSQNPGGIISKLFCGHPQVHLLTSPRVYKIAMRT